ncbi:fatty acid desaturase [filamentous cyanobacterium CCP5]|nr:fatty acid desaturase [filamentous cyanobacterium CCP5]
MVMQDAINPRQILPADDLKRLNERSNRQGLLQLGAHLSIMAVSGYLWATQPWAIAIPALVIYGFSLATMFAAMHEATHRTAFANNQLNDAVGWFAGLLSFYSGTFYRRYHKWHHRYTQIPGKDPELEDPKPTTRGEYLWQVSGIPWWIGKVKNHWRLATGQFENMPYIPEATYGEMQRSIWLQLGVYGVAIAASAIAGKPWFFTYWLLPLAVGQPFLRMILLAEHTGCTHEDNPLTNTRTTLTNGLVRVLMWNMPYHAEHHLYPSMPFYRLPEAHDQLVENFAYVVPGYAHFNRDLVTSLQ